MFSRLAGDDNEVDAEELQDILTASLSKGELQHIATFSCSTAYTQKRS